MARATRVKQSSSCSGATRTKKGKVGMNPKTYLKFESAVSKTMDFDFVCQSRHRLIMAKIEQMPRAAISD